MEWDKFGGNQKGLPKKLEEEGDEMELKVVKEGWEATKGIIDVMTEVADEKSKYHFLNQILNEVSRS